MSDHNFYVWDGIPVRIEWWDATGDTGEIGVSAITDPAEHPTGTIPVGERHALVEICGGRGDGFWATEEAVEEHAERIGPTGFSDADE